MRFEPRTFFRGTNSLPDDRLRHGNVRSPVVPHARKQPSLRLHPAPILASGLQQLRTEQDITITSTLAFAHMDDHAFAINVLNLESAPAVTRQ
jgi:hypothetical protein